MSLLIALLPPACAVGARETGTPLPASAINLKADHGIALHNYHARPASCSVRATADNNLDSTSSPLFDLGPGWGLGAYLLPFIEEENTFAQINFNVAVATGTNTTVSQQAIVAYQCPTDPLQQSFGLYDSSFGAIIATVCIATTSAATAGWECFGNAGGNYQPSNDPNQSLEDGDGLGSGTGLAGNGMFFRNSRTTTAKVTDGLSKTIIVGEPLQRSLPQHLGQGVVVGARDPLPGWRGPGPLLLRPPGPAFDNADYGEALVLGHGNATHVPCADSPIFDPDTFLQLS